MAGILARRQAKRAATIAVAPRPAPPPGRPRSQTAAAAAFHFEDIGWKDWKFGSIAWQVEGWRHYDRCGELHSVANAVANMISRCEIAIYKKTDEGEAGERATEQQIVDLSKGMLGGAEERPENLRLAGLNMFVPGEYFTFIETPKKAPEGTPDRWIILSVTQVKKAGGDPKLNFERPRKYGGGTIDYWIPEGKDPGKDKRRMAENTGVLIRSWTQHGQLPDHPDSSVRAAIPVLNLIEQYDKRASAQNDSRLAGAGVMFLPSSFDFPKGDTDLTSASAFEARLGDAMGKTLRDPSNARSLVPIMATVDGEHIDKIKWMTFETPLDEQTSARLDQCIRRLALDLDVPPEMLLGVGSMNHWSAWQSEASTHKTFVAPLLARICHGYTEGWLKPILAAMGVEADQYMVWFDMAPLTVRPDRQADAIALWDRGLINNEAVLDAGNWPTSAAHTPESYKVWVMTRMLMGNPQLLSDPQFAGAIGINPVQAMAPAAALPPAAGEQTPADKEAPKAVEGPPAEPKSSRSPAQEALVTGAEMAALHSLAVAGKKLLTRGVRDTLLHEFSGRPFDLHTRLGVRDLDHATQLLDGTWDLLPSLALRTGTDERILRDILGFYCSGQMVAQAGHNPDTLTFYLSEGILAAGHRHCSDGRCSNQLNPAPCPKALVPA
jgi:hypothetical protein